MIIFSIVTFVCMFITVMPCFSCDDLTEFHSVYKHNVSNRNTKVVDPSPKTVAVSPNGLVDEIKAPINMKRKTRDENEGEDKDDGSENNVKRAAVSSEDMDERIPSPFFSVDDLVSLEMLLKKCEISRTGPYDQKGAVVIVDSTLDPEAESDSDSEMGT